MFRLAWTRTGTVAAKNAGRQNSMPPQPSGLMHFQPPRWPDRVVAWPHGGSGSRPGGIEENLDSSQTLAARSRCVEVTMAGTRLDGRVERGNRTRQLVLRRTVDIASVEGLEALSVGRLATELDLSKSGVFALFGSKQELQLATVREAARIYVERILRPAAETPAGITRLR